MHNQSIAQSVSYAVSHSHSQSVAQSFSHAVSQSLSQSVLQSVSCTVSQLCSQSVAQSVSCAVSRRFEFINDDREKDVVRLKLTMTTVRRTSKVLNYQ